MDGESERKSTAQMIDARKHKKHKRQLMKEEGQTTNKQTNEKKE